jgi:NAD(P)-dependent dehydrogenase (short-subunit alcohol dehydrogenase family)
MEKKTILITGSTDGIGLETARILISRGHNVLLHGRNTGKLEKVSEELGISEIFMADLSLMSEVKKLAFEIGQKYSHLDVLINNAGVFTKGGMTPDGLDRRFAVNTIAPYFLTKLLLPLMDTGGRVINLSSAAQAIVKPDALTGKKGALPAGEAYAMSKLALTMWSRFLGLALEGKGPAIIAVNPASMLGSKMVKEAYGVTGGDLGIGADILCRAALSDEFSDATGKYFDNDRGIFASPHPDALDDSLTAEIVRLIEDILVKTGVNK